MPVKRVTIRYKNKGVVNGYIKPNTKNGKSGLDFRQMVCYNMRKRRTKVLKQRKSTLGNYSNSFLMYLITDMQKQILTLFAF